jgi:hypothetical protein
MYEAVSVVISFIGFILNTGFEHLIFVAAKITANESYDDDNNNK